jgi:17beta-estradiol 17-dehydrogenase / very-long-chain 3-oxoacyl-CoA reductase
MIDPIPILAFIGGFVVLLQLKKLLSAIWFYFLRPTSWQIYLRGQAPYALITGATDGIGKGVAKDLYRKGFNLILHGRNEAKMNKVVEELKALGGKARENGDIKVFLADVKEDGHDFKAIAKKYEGLDITIVVNNVGGMIFKDAT